MADEEYNSQEIHNIYAGGDPRTTDYGIASGESLSPGDQVGINTSGLLVANKSTDGPAVGVLGLKPGQDIDTAYTREAGVLYPVYRIGQKTHVWVTLEATSPVVALKDGMKVSVGTEDGKVRAFSYTNAAEATDHDSHTVGRFVDEYDAGHLTDDHKIKINLGG